jgi:hypothetical protein
MSEDITWTIRRAEVSELPLIRNSWFLSHQRANADVRGMGPREYARWANTLHDDVLRQMPDILVADVDGLIIGWGMGLAFTGCYSVVYMYTKSHSRRLGVAKSLLAEMAKLADGTPLRAGMWSDNHGATIRRYVPDFVHIDQLLSAP